MDGRGNALQYDLVLNKRKRGRRMEAQTQQFYTEVKKGQTHTSSNVSAWSGGRCAVVCWAGHEFESPLLHNLVYIFSSLWEGRTHMSGRRAGPTCRLVGRAHISGCCVGPTC
jgi:hypothetical protein